MIAMIVKRAYPLTSDLFFFSYGWGKKWGGGCREGEGRENAKHPGLDYH